MERSCCRRTLTIPSRTDKLSLVREMVRLAIQEGGFQTANSAMLVLAVDEAVTNVIEHGYENRQEGQIVIEVAADPERLEVLIQDWGDAFDPEHVPQVNINDHVKAGKKKGLGIFLIKKIMDEVDYTFPENGSNRLTMIKYAVGSPA